MKTMLGRLLLIASVTGLVLVAVCATWLYWALWRPLDNRVTDLELRQGASAQQVLRQLNRAGLLPSPIAGRLYLELRGGDRSPRYGRYRFPARARPVDTLEQVLEGRVETIEITVVEGLTAPESIRLFTDVGIGTHEEWQGLLGRVDWLQGIAPEATSLEGFLFPDSYRFALGLSADSAARHMVERFLDVWREETAGVTDPWATPYEVVTLASLVEAETSIPEERERIAGVFLNRLDRGMLLQCDPTVVYALKRRGEWRGRLLRRHWQVDDPFNTYRYPGLPPGPINSPGRAAIAAALRPQAHSYLYFVASPQGGHSFSRTLKEHNRAVAELQRFRK
jgi:UPF0755 protein